MKKISFHKTVFILAFLLASLSALAQRRGTDIFRDIGSRIPQGGGGQGGSGSDSVIARNRFEDSVTVTVYYLDSTRGHRLDSNINDFTRRFPIPATHVYLGNTGVATRSLLFGPGGHAGFDPGFHALDVYKWRLEKVRFFNTTRPYTELGYMLASRAEQIIDILHTQNIRPHWNFSLAYRLINAPGFFRNQKTNHNNYLFNTWYQSPSRRYNNYFVILNNALQAGENGGIRNDEDYLNNIIYARDRFIIPTKIGGSPVYGTDFFSSNIATGNRYTELNILMRQQYDLGKKDSIVTDSTVIPLFYPRLRFEHSFRYGNYKYHYKDVQSFDQRLQNTPDPDYYSNFYQVPVPSSDSLFFRDNWKEISNDFSIYQFPDARNLHQFFKLGLEVQILSGSFFKDSVHLPSTSLYNLMAHGEYRNRTRNQKWDMQAFGKLWLNGYNLGDYHAFVSLQRLLSQRLGSLQLGFENINRPPSFIFDKRSGFYLDDPNKSFAKENTIHLFASIMQPRLRLQLGADYYLMSNYLYLTDFYRLQQESRLFNVLRISARKTFKVGKRWNWHTEVHIQQKTGAAQLNLPLIFTRNRFLYEGSLGFPNLQIAMGLEARYHTPYKADNYSPVLGQFFYQDSVQISNLPDVAAMIHFRIRSFRAYFRAENLNTARLFGGFQFNNNNLAAPDYPTPGLVIRFGIYWSFVN